MATIAQENGLLVLMGEGTSTFQTEKKVVRKGRNLKIVYT